MKIVSMQVGPLGTNCYLLCDTDAARCAVIDPGGDARRILRAAEENGCAIDAIYLTHGHYDHVGGLPGLRGALPDAPVYLNERDVYDPADRYMAQVFPHVDGTRSYDEGDVLTLGALSVRVLATPGHTRGGVSLLAGDALFCGDTLFAGSMGRTDLPGGDEQAIFRSLARLAALKEDTRVYPGHMGPSTIARERACNPYVLMALGELR
ncbi:MAG: MBL fold metallo-hydrolase [Oscillibacter sp.]|nr:MBL fold metallo-hydrolase [Oscillibacter sp.]